jgi:hypothetical protein
VLGAREPLILNPEPLLLIEDVLCADGTEGSQVRSLRTEARIQ